jgi:hypothetical protein
MPPQKRKKAGTRKKASAEHQNIVLLFTVFSGTT